MIALKRQGGDAQSVVRREGMIWHFKGHPYGHDPLLGLNTIPGISREDLTAFLRTYFVPSNMVVSIAGDIEKSKVIEGLGKFFQALPEGEAPERRLDEPAETPPVLALIHKPGQVQSQVSLALHGVRRIHPDYWKMSLLMNIFGGSESLMFTRLREDLGLVYSAGFYQTYKWKAGILAGYIGCKGDRTVEAIRETVKIMNGLRNSVPKKDFEQKRLDALNSFVFNVDTPASLVEVYGRYHMRREPLDTLDRIQDTYIGANREELEILAGNLLNPNKLQVFVVGDKMTKVRNQDGSETTLEENLKNLAVELGLPFREIPLR
jgi:zinc protease